MDEQVTILHTNDIHSHFENWPRIQRYLLTEREQRRQSGSHVITVDLGDAVDRAHPLSEATQGQANVALLNGIGYDAVTIGNNEGLGLTHGALNQLYDRANFDVILDNLTDTATICRRGGRYRPRSSRLRGGRASYCWHSRRHSR